MSLDSVLDSKVNFGHSSFPNFPKNRSKMHISEIIFVSGGTENGIREILKIKRVPFGSLEDNKW